MLARTLDVDTHIISKGGTGVSDSFGGLDILLHYWDNLSHTNLNSAATGLPWDTATWKPDVAIIAIGHNDQFNSGPANFVSRYGQFKSFLRTAYPDAKVISTNTLISSPLGFFGAAIHPLLTDPAHSFAFQFDSMNDNATQHPALAGHAAMVHGDGLRFSLADVVEDRAGWCLETPLTGYEEWTLANYTPEQIANGSHDPSSGLAAGDDTAALLRYALGRTSTDQNIGLMPQGGRDAEGKLTLSFLRARADVDYGIFVSDDLVVWSRAALNPGTPREPVVWQDSSLSPTRFMRLNVALKN